MNIDQKLTELQAEWQKGQQMLADLNQQQQNITRQMLHIEGAISLLQEIQADKGEQ